MIAVALLCVSYQLPLAARPAHHSAWAATSHSSRSQSIRLSSTSNTLCAAATMQAVPLPSMFAY